LHLKHPFPASPESLPAASPDARLGMVIREIELVLAEKRTALSLLRTGIAISALPLSVLSLLIATSHLYEAARVLPMLVALLAISSALTLLGGFLVVRALHRIHSCDAKIRSMKAHYRDLAPYLE
jgi:uncharacterized membrane protein YidH (DUF202 family)